MSSRLPPKAVDSDAKPAPKNRPSPHERALAKLPEKARSRYETSVKLIEKICGDHARAVAQAAERGEDPPQPDAELVSAIAEYSVSGRLS